MYNKRIIWGLVALLTLPFFYNAPWVSNARAEAATTVEASYPGLAAGVLCSAKIVDLEKGLLLLGDGIEIRENFTEEIFGQVTPDIQKELEKSLFFLLEQEAIQELVMQDAKTLGISMDGPDEEIGTVYLDQITKGVTTTESEVRAFYDNNKEMVGGMPFDQVKGSIEQFLLQQKKQEFLDTHIKTLGQKAHIRLNRDWVKQQARLALNNPVDQARMSGKPTLAEFGASGCVPCDMMQPILENLRKKYPDKLNVVFIHVRENQMLAARFGIRAIPVQVFYDAKGKEVFRHQGFYAEVEVLKQLKKMGVS